MHKSILGLILTTILISTAYAQEAEVFGFVFGTSKTEMKKNFGWTAKELTWSADKGPAFLPGGKDGKMIKYTLRFSKDKRYTKYSFNGKVDHFGLWFDHNDLLYKVTIESPRLNEFSDKQVEAKKLFKDIKNKLKSKNLKDYYIGSLGSCFRERCQYSIEVTNEKTYKEMNQILKQKQTEKKQSENKVLNGI